MPKKSYRNKGSKKNIVISIAGVHGVGKTTIFNLLKKKLEDNNKFKFYRERYIKNPPFPFGSSNKQVAFRSEMHFLQQFIRRNRSIRNYCNRYNGRILIMDRTPTCVLIYSKALFLKEKDYHLIFDLYNSVKWREDYIIYLIAEPETILKRTIQRGSLDKQRKYWNEDEKEYLLNVLSFYNQFLVNEKSENELSIINTEDLVPNQVLRQIKKIITKLTEFSFKEQVETASTQTKILKFLD
ncbi:MAG: Thymidylate kinase [Promethearchaeota archaeon]|nr:MAG: Thymidylate kinase [Candidatus Lokiarchaeota archaeon]